MARGRVGGGGGEVITAFPTLGLVINNGEGGGGGYRIEKYVYETWHGPSPLDATLIMTDFLHQPPCDLDPLDVTVTSQRQKQNRKIAGSKLFASPLPQDRVKPFAPHPLLKNGNFLRPPFSMAKTLFAPRPPPLFVGVKLHMPSHSVAPPPPRN